MQLQVGDVQTQLARAFDITGPMVTDVLATASPTIEVGPNAPVPIQTVNPWIVGGQIIGDATHTGVVGVFSPKAQNLWLVVDRLEVLIPAIDTHALIMIVGEQTATGAVDGVIVVNQVSAFPLDSREPMWAASSVGTGLNLGVSGPAFNVGGLGVGAVSIDGGIRVPALTWTDLLGGRGAILRPNTGLFTGGATVATTWYWRAFVRLFEVRQR